MSKDSVRERGKALEESFFHSRNSQLLDNLRAELAAMKKKEALSSATGVDDDSLLDQLLDCDISNETMAAFSLYPLVAVAWADGRIQDNERAAILAAMAEDGLNPEAANYRLLQNWLDTQPDDQLLKAWKGYVASLCQQIGTEQASAIKTKVLGRASRVAAAAGGILGIGNKISDSESAVLSDLDSSFS